MWFESKVYEELKEQDENATLQDCFCDPLQDYVNDFINLNITKNNYLKLTNYVTF